MTTRTLLLTSSLLVLVPAAARAAAGTCTVTAGGYAVVANVPSAGRFVFRPQADGIALPVEIDEQAGTFTIDPSPLAQTNFDTDGGVVGLSVTPHPFTGTIDAGGDVTVPNFAAAFLFGGLTLPINPTLLTGPQSQLINATEFPQHGEPLDFTTGQLTLTGSDIIPSAPIVEESVISGLRLTCRLAPIPSAANLPGAPQAKVKGKVKTGAAGQGDAVQLTAKLKAGRSAFDFAHQTLIVRVASATSTDVFVAVVRATSLHGKGKVSTAKDSDGQTIQIAVGHTMAAPFKGSLRIVNAGKRATLALHLAGVDTSMLGAGAVVTIGSGTNVTTTTLVVGGNGKKRTFHG